MKKSILEEEYFLGCDGVVWYKLIHITEEHTAVIFRVEE
jgi:hypothetical protein